MNHDTDGSKLIEDNVWYHQFKAACLLIYVQLHWALVVACSCVATHLAWFTWPVWLPCQHNWSNLGHKGWCGASLKAPGNLECTQFALVLLCDDSFHCTVYREGSCSQSVVCLLHRALQVRPECVLQPAEQVHLQVLPLPLHRVHGARCCGHSLLRSHVPAGCQEGIFRTREWHRNCAGMHMLFRAFCYFSIKFVGCIDAQAALAGCRSATVQASTCARQRQPVRMDRLRGRQADVEKINT